jgi:hypothetical protein
MRSRCMGDFRGKAMKGCAAAYISLPRLVSPHVWSGWGWDALRNTLEYITVEALEINSMDLRTILNVKLLLKLNYFTWSCVQFSISCWRINYSRHRLPPKAGLSCTKDWHNTARAEFKSKSYRSTISRGSSERRAFKHCDAMSKEIWMLYWDRAWNIVERPGQNKLCTMWSKSMSVHIAHPVPILKLVLPLHTRRLLHSRRPLAIGPLA